MTEVQKENIKQWVEALRSGNYNQVRHKLRDERNNTFCCLGVACDIAPDVERIEDGQYLFPNGEEHDGYPSEHWFKNQFGFDFEDQLASKKGRHSLVTLNDSYDFNFGDIAEALEDNYLKQND